MANSTHGDRLSLTVARATVHGRIQTCVRMPKKARSFQISEKYVRMSICEMFSVIRRVIVYLFIKYRYCTCHLAWDCQQIRVEGVKTEISKCQCQVLIGWTVWYLENQTDDIDRP